MKLSDIIVVTTSKHKLGEINKILGTNHKVSKVEIPEIQSLSLDEVITQKAKTAYEIFKKPVLVEDVSLEIKALKGLPGTLVKFFMTTLGTEGTVNLVKGNNTTTSVTSAIALYDGRTLKIFKGKTKGTLSRKDRGKSGFYFDKIFVPSGYTQTYAQLTNNIKNKISHRAKALNKLKKYLS